MTARKSFTLIELMVVVGIIAALAGIGIFLVPSQKARIRNANRMVEAKLLQLGMERYYVAHGKYPYPQTDVTGASISFGPANLDAQGNYLNSQPWCGSPVDFGWQALRALLVPKYIDHLPLDPLMTGPGAGDKSHAWNVIVSGPSDDSQHYVIELPLEKAGASGIIQGDGLISGNVDIEIGMFYHGDYMIYTMETETTRVGPDAGSSFLCNGWGWNAVSPYYQGARVACGVSNFSGNAKFPAGKYYTACVGSVRHLNDEAPTNIGNIWSYCDNTLDRDYPKQCLPSGHCYYNGTLDEAPACSGGCVAGKGNDIKYLPNYTPGCSL